MAWSNADPGQGDLAQLDNARDALNAWIEKLDAIATNSWANRNVISTEVWSGSSTDAWVGRFTTAMQPVTSLKDAFGKARDALDTYRSAVSAIKTNAEPWREDVTEATYYLNTPQMTPNPPPEELVLELARKRRAAESKLETAQSMLQQYANQRQDADDALVGALNAALPPEWAGQRAALAAVGIDSVAKIANFGTVQDSMLELSQELIDYAGQGESAAALTALLQLYGDDQRLMSSYYQELGGERTVQLIDSVGTAGMDGLLASGAALALAVAIRGGLATGSTDWSDNQAADFATGMMDGPSDHGADIGFLFNDASNPLGVTLAVAMADAWDRWERIDGNTYRSSSPPSGGLWLSGEEHGQWGMRVEDPSGPIFSTLGRYPDAAFEWLTSSEGNAIDGDAEYDYGGRFDIDDRVTFWFDTRFELDEQGFAPSNVDQLQGISELFFGALQASGGPTDINGVQAGDVATPWQSAALSHDVILALLENEHFTQDGINALSSAALAGAFGINMPGFAEYPITQNFYGDITDYGSFQTVTGPGGGQLVVPVLTDDQLAKFLGVAGSHESGMAQITESIREYQQTLLNASITNPEAFPLSQAMDRITSLEAALQGASIGEKIETAAEQDQAVRDAVSAISSVVGAVPIPGLGEAVGGVAGFGINWMQSVATGTVTGELTDGIGNIFATNEAYQTALADAGELDRETHARMVIASMVHTYLERTGVDPGFGTPPNPASYSDPDDYFTDATTWYGDNQSAIDAAISSNGLSDQTVDGIASDYDDTEDAYQARV